MDYTIVFRRDTHLVKEPPEVRTKGKWLHSYLVIKTLANISNEIIIDEGNIGENIIVDKKNHRLFYNTSESNLTGSRNNYFNIFNYNTMQKENKVFITDKGYSIYDMFFDDINENVYFNVYNSYLRLNIQTNIVEEISDVIYNEETDKLKNLRHSSSTFISDTKELKLFFIFPYSDYLPSNYKRKYNGTYIYDGQNNIRISKKNDGYALTTPTFWLNDGNYVIKGGYIYDTSGKTNETKVIDGLVLAVF